MPQITKTIIGGAGSGKTSRLMAEIDDAAARYGGIEAVGFSSMTRAARAEAVSRASRAFGVSEADLSRDGWFRTLHGVCYAALGVSSSSMIADGPAAESWLHDEVFPGLAFGPGSNPATVGFRRKVTPDVAIDVWDYARNSVITLAEACKFHRVPVAKVLPLVDRYETAKRVAGKIDFVDLMMQFVGCVYPAISENPKRVAPRGECPEVRVWLFDESQDMNRLCDIVARRLAATPSVEKVILCGDPFQSIFGFAGSSSRWMLRWNSDREIMPTSHRCPSRILEAGESRLRKLKAGEYWDRKIAASRDGGDLCSIRSIRGLVSAIDPADDWLLVARSNYQAKKLADEAEYAGIPWAWTSETADDHSAAIRAGFKAAVDLERGRSISRQDVESLFAAIPTLAAGERLWQHGAKSAFAIAKHEPGARFSRDDLANIGATEKLVSALGGPDWPTIAKKGAAAWRRRVAQYGEQLTSNPRVRIGTVHSVKGAEADNVGILYAPTARSVTAQSKSREIYNEERRIEYVAITRARKTVLACYPPRTGLGPGKLW